jgi:polysaccharide lyase-like protein
MRLHRHKFKEAVFFQNGEYTSRFADSSEFSEKGSSNLRIGLVLLSFLLMTLAVGFEFEFGAAFPLNIISGLRSKHSAASSPPPGSVLWSADMEIGDLSQWSWPDVPGGPNAGGGVFDSGTSIASVDTVSLAHSGTHSAKLYINTMGPPEISTSGVRLFRWLEPESHSELYYSVWYCFPQRYTPNGNPPWWNVLQWKSKGANVNDAFFALNVGNRSDGSLYLYLYNQNSKTSYSQAIKNISEGQWFHIEAFYKCAGDKTGHVTFWQDDAQIFDVPSVQTRYPDGTCAWSVNNYSDSLNPTTATIYVDDAAICAGGRCP